MLIKWKAVFPQYHWGIGSRAPKDTKICRAQVPYKKMAWYCPITYVHLPICLNHL
jgi:hypothetical protein